ncbi:hypothetical protein V5799_033852 [Amblyomma americanum]|uniref:Uncharacterized protein n=1 Tax=Amblyomma americanum TaxID=6943 RepID=A0AAQ4DM48_AMBAM
MVFVSAMNPACGSILFTYALYVYLGDQIFATAGAIDMPEGLQGLWNQTLTLFNKTESALANNLAPSVRHRIVTDVNFGGHRMAEIFEDKNTSDFINCNVIGDKNQVVWSWRHSKKLRRSGKRERH